MNNDFEGNDYGFNDFKDNDDFSNELKDYDSELVDVRIILTNLDYLEHISKAVSNFDLSNFNVGISSIIPTKDVEIAKNTIVGADLVLVATESNAEGHRLYQKFKKSLDNDLNLIEYLKLPSLEELNDYGYDFDGENIFEDEIANSIIRGGLYSISNLSSINDSKRKYIEVKKDYQEESLRYDKINKENDFLIRESKAIRERNEKLIEEVKILQRQLDKIKSDYSDLKSRFEGIHSKNSLEVYSLNDLWYDLFGEYLSQEVYKFILISTDNFRPKNLMIGQGAICAESKDDALDWLKIIKTAFILADTNKQDLDYNNFNSNFIFKDIEEFGGTEENKSLSEEFPSFSLDNSNDSDSNEDSIFNNGNNLFNVDDGFIYNERFEGHGSEDSKSLDELFNEKLNEKVRNEESINVFNLKSLQSIESEDDDSNIDEEISRYIEDDDEDYDFDDEKKKNNENYDDYEDYEEYEDDEEIEESSSPFSSLW